MLTTSTSICDLLDQNVKLRGLLSECQLHVKVYINHSENDLSVVFSAKVVNNIR